MHSNTRRQAFLELLQQRAPRGEFLTRQDQLCFQSQLTWIYIQVQSFSCPDHSRTDRYSPPRDTWEVWCPLVFFEVLAALYISLPSRGPHPPPTPVVALCHFMLTPRMPNSTHMFILPSPSRPLLPPSPSAPSHAHRGWPHLPTAAVAETCDRRRRPECRCDLRQVRLQSVPKPCVRVQQRCVGTYCCFFRARVGVDLCVGVITRHFTVGLVVACSRCPCVLGTGGAFVYHSPHERNITTIKAGFLSCI